MKILFTESVAGVNFAYRPGEEFDLRDDIALGFLRANQAIPVREAERESAIVGIREKAVRGIRRTRKALGV